MEKEEEREEENHQRLSEKKMVSLIHMEEIKIFSS